MSSLTYCDGNISTGPNFEAICYSGWHQIDASQTELLLSGGFDSEAFALGFSGVITLWVTGLAIGLIVAQIRKLKRG